MVVNAGISLRCPRGSEPQKYSQCSLSDDRRGRGLTFEEKERSREDGNNA